LSVTMGYTMAKVKLRNPHDLSKHMELELLVDTGSIYTWVKRVRLEQLGIKPITGWKFRTIEGKVIERDMGEAIIECLGERATRIVVFAEEGDAEVLGLTPWKDLGLKLTQ